jgi:SAM-dependent methyltransferase
MSVNRRSLSGFYAQAGMLALLLAFALEAPGKTREECEKAYKPQSGQHGKDVIWVPTTDSLVTRMLEMAKVAATDRVFDLGAGDGKIAIAAAKEFGATAVGIEYEPEMARFAQCLVEVAGVQGKVKIIQGDIFEEDFSSATVVTLYLLPELNLKLRPTILAMKPGTRVVSHSFTMDDWEPDAESTLSEGSAYFWVVPAKVAGDWTFRPRSGSGAQFSVHLDQTFQKLQGNAGGQPISAAKLTGSQIELSFSQGGEATVLQGQVEDDQIAARVTRGGKTAEYVGTRK